MRRHSRPALLLAVMALVTGCSAFGSDGPASGLPGVPMAAAPDDTTVALQFMSLPKGPPPDRSTPATTALPDGTTSATGPTTSQPSATSAPPPASPPVTQPSAPDPADQVAVDAAVAVLLSVPHSSDSAEALLVLNGEGQFFGFDGPLGAVRVERPEGYQSGVGPLHWLAGDGATQGSWFDDSDDLYMTGALFGEVWADDPALAALAEGWGIVDTGIVGFPVDVFDALGMPWADHDEYLDALSNSAVTGPGEAVTGGTRYPVELDLGHLIGTWGFNAHAGPAWLEASLVEAGLDAATVGAVVEDLDVEEVQGWVTLDDQALVVEFYARFDLGAFFARLGVLDDVGLGDGWADVSWAYTVDHSPAWSLAAPTDGYTDVTDEIAAVM